MKKYRINIPKGKKVESREVKGNDIVIHLADEFTPKDGDVCYVKEYAQEYIFILKLNSELAVRGLCCYEPFLSIKHGFCSREIVTSHVDDFHLATEEEEKLFFDKLKEERNQTFNFETKQFEDIRWRAEKGCLYEAIITDCHGVQIGSFTDRREDFDNNAFRSGNYYNPTDHEKTQSRVDEINAIIRRR